MTGVQTCALPISEYAVAKGVTFVNHTFTSHLALSASMQAFAGLPDHRICEYPFQPKQLSIDFVATPMVRNAQGEVAAPDAPGLGVAVDTAGMRRYLVDVDITVGGRTLYVTPALD